MFRILLISLTLMLSCKSKAEGFNFNLDAMLDTVKQDYQNFYTLDNGKTAAGVFALGAVMAHSNIDTEFQSWYHQDIHSSLTDDAASVAKLFGEKWLMIPISALASSYQFDNSDSLITTWGQLTLRSYLVGSPVIGVTQPLTGGSRPRDEYQDAHWRPFNDDNGVSGHSFVGAVPFLVLANMPELSESQRMWAYAASGLSAWSRVNDNAHYLSQALLGWYVAWESVNAVNKTGSSDTWYTLSPKVFGDGVGLSVSIQW